MTPVFPFIMRFHGLPASRLAPRPRACIAVLLRPVPTHTAPSEGVHGRTNDRPTSADPYSVLGVSRDTSPSHIKEAYYRQSFLHHPDRNHGNEEAARRFTAVVEAYRVLGNPSLRRKYDRGVLTTSDIQAVEKAVQSPRETGKPIPGEWGAGGHRYCPSYGFDTFYRSTYSHQLREVQDRRQRRKKMLNMEERSKESFMPVAVLAVAVIFISSLFYF
uniref:DnaJ heat shock protein family (Hsp40) member C30 n=1 Tax=Eptatretus burgeri TaxID=7764 RepID=A0A8C4N4I3_EPTBU